MKIKPRAEISLGESKLVIPYVPQKRFIFRRRKGSYGEYLEENERPSVKKSRDTKREMEIHTLVELAFWLQLTGRIAKTKVANKALRYDS